MLNKFVDTFTTMFECSFLYHPLKVMIWMGRVGMVTDGEVEFFARELLGKGSANEEENLLHVTCI